MKSEGEIYKMKKQDIYNYLTKKKNETLDAKVTPLNNAWKEKEKEETGAVLNSSGADFDKMINAMKIAKVELEKMRDSLDWSSYVVEDAISGMSRMTTFDKIVEVTNSSIKEGVESGKVRHVYHEKRRLVLEEFSKIEAMVRSASTAKKACDILRELGFDVSKIEVKPRNEIATVNVNKELLGLPEIN